jgi:hypothetical protein
MTFYDWQAQALKLFDFKTNKTTCFLCPRRTGKTEFLNTIQTSAAASGVENIKIIHARSDLTEISNAKMILVDELNFFSVDQLTALAPMAGKVPIIGVTTPTGLEECWITRLAPCSVHRFSVDLVPLTEYLGCQEYKNESPISQE